MYECILSSYCCVWLIETQWTVALQAPLSMGFPRKEYWSGLQFPSPLLSSISMKFLSNYFELLIRQKVHIHYLGTVTEKLLCFSLNILVLYCLCPLKSQVAVFAFKEAVTPSCLYRLTWGGKYTITLIGILRLFQTFFKETPVPCTQFLLGENSETPMLLSMQQRQSLCQQFSGCFPEAMPNAHIHVLYHRPTGTGWLLDVPQAIWKGLDATVETYTGSWP